MTEISNPHDRFFKEVLSRQEVARDFLLNYVPASLVGLLDIDSLEIRKASFVDKDQGATIHRLRRLHRLLNKNRKIGTLPIFSVANEDQGCQVLTFDTIRSREPGAEAGAGKVSERPETPRAYEQDRGQASKLIADGNREP